MRKPALHVNATEEFLWSDNVALFYGTAPLTRPALLSVARLAAEGRTVWVLDGANSFDAYLVARLARGSGYAPETVLTRIRLSRAFTCFQLAELVTHKLPAAIDPGGSAAVVCLGLLDTLYDEDVPMSDSIRLLRQMLAAFHRLAGAGHRILITAREPRAELRERVALLNLLKASVQHRERVDPPPTRRLRMPTQLRLMAG